MIDLERVRRVAKTSDRRTADQLRRCADELERSRTTIVALEAELSSTRRERDTALDVAMSTARDAGQAIRRLDAVRRVLGARNGENAVTVAKRIANTMRECLGWMGLGSAN